jgi:hypothetical protein
VVYPEITAIVMQQIVERYPCVSEHVSAISHDPDVTVGQGCDDRFEFEFARSGARGLKRLPKTEAQAQPAWEVTPVATPTEIRFSSAAR